MALAKRALAALLLGTLLLGRPAAASAGEARVKPVLQDAFYGALAGAVVGSAALAFDNDSEDDLRYVLYGAAAGAVVGALYGAAASPRPLASVEGAGVRLAVPTPVPAVAPGADGRPTLVVRADLLQARF